MRGELDAVLFDAGGVLVLPDPTVLGPLLAPYGGDPAVERHVRAHYAGMAVKSEQGADEHDWLAYDDGYVARVGVAGPDVAEAAVVIGATRTAWLLALPDRGVGRRAGASSIGGVCRSAWSRTRPARSRACCAARAVCQVGRG